MHPSITLGANTYYVRPFAPRFGMKVWGDLWAKFGPAVAHLLAAEDRGGGLSGAAETLFSSLPGDEQVRMFSLVVQPDYVSVTQTPPDGAVKLTDTEVDRRMDLTEMFDLWWFAVRVQFGPLLLRLIGQLGAVLSPEVTGALERSVKMSPQNS